MTTSPYVERARQYEDDVLAGRADVCKWVRLAVERNRRDLARAAASDPTFPYEFSVRRAHRVCRCAELLPYIKGDRAKRIGRDKQRRWLWATIQLEPWQCWVLTTCYGWLRRGTALRRFVYMLWLMPRKNAKSTLAAVCILYLLTSDDEMGAECYSGATTRDQAKTIGQIAYRMTERSPAFRDSFGVHLGARSTLRIEVPTTGSFFIPLSADAHSLDSLDISAVAIDELHAHRTRDVFDVLTTATGARLQPVVMMPTTAGENVMGICYEQVDYARKVLEGVFPDESYFAVEYSIDKTDDWRAEASWRKANPNWGVSVQPEDMARKARQALRSRSAERTFKVKHLGIWETEASLWFPIADWQRQADPGLTLEALKGVPCWVGVDLAEVRDLAVVASVFRLGDDEYAFACRIYMPEESELPERVEAIRGWVEDGHIIVTPGNQTDYGQIEDDLEALFDQCDVREIDFDRALAAQMAQNLKKRLEPRLGLEAVEACVLTVPQTRATMHAAMQKMERLVLSRSGARHPGNPAYTWMWSNVVVDKNLAGEMYPRKSGGKDSPNKIDGPVATLTALSRAMLGVVQVAAPTYLYAVFGGKR